jgi:hypothetical protein
MSSNVGSSEATNEDEASFNEALISFTIMLLVVLRTMMLLGVDPKTQSINHQLSFDLVLSHPRLDLLFSFLGEDLNLLSINIGSIDTKTLREMHRGDDA